MFRSTRLLMSITGLLGVLSLAAMSQRLDGASPPARPNLPLRAAPPIQPAKNGNNVKQQPQIGSGYMGNNGGYQWNQQPPTNFSGMNPNGFGGNNSGNGYGAGFGSNSFSGNGFNGQFGNPNQGFNGQFGNPNQGYNGQFGNPNQGYNGQFGGPGRNFNGQSGVPNNGPKGGLFCGFNGV